MKTMAPEAPTSQTSARCSATTPGADRRRRREVSGCRRIRHHKLTLRRNPYAIAAAQSAPDADSRIGLRSDVNRRSRSCHQRQRRLQQDEEVEQHRPVLDVVEVELDALLDLLLAVDLAAPAVDLRPAGDPGLDAVAREIAVDGLVEQPVLQLALHRVRARADQRQVALEHHVEQLRQLVEAGLADEAADAGDARIVLGDDLGRRADRPGRDTSSGT